MFRVKLSRYATALLLSTALLGAGCGNKVNLAKSDNPDDIKPPATAGSPDSLMDTSWLFENLDMVVTFRGDTVEGAAPLVEGAAPVVSTMKAVLSNPQDPTQSLVGYWRLRPDGVISITTMGNTKAGTWDGERLVLSGETGTRVEGR